MFGKKKEEESIFNLLGCEREPKKKKINKDVWKKKRKKKLYLIFLIIIYECLYNILIEEYRIV